tara:strand:+ start:629 stop:907 length:279 start_codon:yes stop_codon:yes gene_type:complete
MKTPRGDCSNCANCPEHGNDEDCAALTQVIEELKDDRKTLHEGFIALNTQAANLWRIIEALDPTLSLALIDDNSDIRLEAKLMLLEEKGAER